jgi:hypothetical protein
LFLPLHCGIQLWIFFAAQVVQPIFHNYLPYMLIHYSRVKWDAFNDYPLGLHTRPELSCLECRTAPSSLLSKLSPKRGTGQLGMPPCLSPDHCLSSRNEVPRLSLLSWERKENIICHVYTPHIDLPMLLKLVCDTTCCC